MINLKDEYLENIVGGVDIWVDPKVPFVALDWGLGNIAPQDLGRQLYYFNSGGVIGGIVSGAARGT